MPNLSVSERLSRLRAYDEAWYTAPLQFCPLLATEDPDEYEDWWTTTGGTIPYTSRGTIRLFRPPSVSRAVPERTWTLDFPEDFEEHPAWISVDFAQDLIVLSRMTRIQLEDSLDCHLYSIERGCAPHPLAIQPILGNRSEAPTPRATACDTFIFGDLIGCTIYGNVKRMLVVNWKTGVTVWDYHYTGRAYFYIIDSSRLILVEGYTMRIYTFDPTATSSRDVAAPNPGASCELLLPPLASEATASLFFCESQLASVTFTDCTPIFSNDPSSGIIAVFYSIGSNALVDFPESDQALSWACLLMLLPIHTVLSQADYVSSGRSQTLATGGHIIPWDEWGPDGTRCLLLDRSPHYLSAVGSKCAMYFPRGDYSDGMADVLIIDARLWVHLASSHHDCHCLYPMCILEPSSFSEHRLFKSPLRSKLPCRAMHKEVYIGSESELASSRMALLEDGLAISHVVNPDTRPGQTTGVNAGFDFLFT
ncbi:hypothetical protein ONZ51_g157 [Trametes cubensis]|uniref:Uncharacterized protein n=1 Tax=Trametes cubensis TaxID=1111947 RepID=A0AAD7U600_9APHY|nr:hypothetical protein ONZ51_g157 [Trametes cubensis]